MSTAVADKPATTKPPVWLNGIPVGWPIVFLRSGIRRPGEEEPATCHYRDSKGILNIVVLQGGTCEYRTCVRYVDDPYFDQFPDQRLAGTWAYCEGMQPSELTARDPQDVLVDCVLDLDRQGIDPGQIAGRLAIKGFTANVVREILKKYKPLSAQ